MNRKRVSLVALGVVGAVLALLVVRLANLKRDSVSAGGANGGDDPQSVTAFAVERTSFTDAIDGLVGTVKGDTIELSYEGPKEPLIAIHVKVGQRVKKGQLLFELDHVRTAARKDQAEAALERAQALYKAGASTPMDLREAKSSFDIAQRDLQDTYIRAPKDGYVSEINGQVGETLGRDSQGAVGVLVSSQDKLFLETGVIEGQLERVKEGQAVIVDIESLGLTSVRGTVAGVSREVTTTGRTGTVHVGLPAQVQATLRPGLSARCRILTFDGAALIIPRQSYDKEKGGVYVIQDGKALFRPVALGYVAPDYYEAREGLSPGNLIIGDLIINPVAEGAAVTVPGEPERYAPPNPSA